MLSTVHKPPAFNISVASLIALRRSMWAIAVALALVMIGGFADEASAKNKLRKCASYTQFWSNCFGKRTVGGHTYEGEWQNGKPHGQGSYTLADGTKYVGNLKNGVPHGRGRYVYPDGSKYNGQFKNAKRHGQGTMSYVGGEQYIGHWRNDKRNGQGAVTHANGDKWVGEFRNGIVHGKAIATYQNGDKYDGEWKDNKWSGQGTYTFANGQKYIGEFKNGKPNGQGTYSWPNGTKYVGQHKDGRFHGEGIRYAADGSISEQGTFEQNKLVKAEVLEEEQLAKPEQQVTNLRAAPKPRPKPIEVLMAAAANLKITPASPPVPTHQNFNVAGSESPVRGNLGPTTIASLGYDDRSALLASNTSTKGSLDNGVRVKEELRPLSVTYANTISLSDLFSNTDALTYAERIAEQKLLNNEPPRKPNFAPCPEKPEIRDSCFGRAKLAEQGGEYEGEWLKNKPHGKGIFRWVDGRVYAGEFKWGKINGNGVLVHPNGTKYLAKWFNGEFYIGRQLFKDGSSYVGRYFGGKFNGQGIYTYADGKRDGGEFKNGLLHGRGVRYSADGSISEQGIFQRGVLVTPKNIVPSAPKFVRFEHLKDIELPRCPSSSQVWNKCYGSFISNNGDQYEGEWDSNKPHGEGIYSFASGETYIGQYEHGKRHGRGVRYAADGSIIQEGVFVNNVFIKYEKVFGQGRAVAEINQSPMENSTNVSSDNRHKIALVIGNNRYRQIPSLDNPVNDANDMAASLQSLGFNVIKALDADRSKMEDTLAEFAKQARSADVALVFYAGHGMQHEGVNYLIPIDGQLSDETDLRRFIKLRSVIDDLENSKGARILIIDACRDNEALMRFAGSLPRTRSLAFGKGLADESAEGVLIAYATQPGKVAVDEVGGRNSPFTAAILKHIKTPETDIRVMFTRVREDVLEATDFKQRPEVSDSMIGEFQFARAAPKDEATNSKLLHSPPIGGRKLIYESLPLPLPPAQPQDGTVAPSVEGYVIQLAAYRSEQDAMSEYQQLRARYSDLLGELPPAIQHTNLGSSGSFYRLGFGPLQSKQAAADLCVKLQAAGAEDCLVRRR